jgi:pyruvate formate lyase activating enzyme
MNIKGVQKTSLIDYPGKISTVLFTGGCNLRCGYCHNPDLACDSCSLSSYTDQEILNIIGRRKGLIEGITISGGEPTLTRDLTAFVRSLKKYGLPVKVDTNGLNPAVVRGLLAEGLVDYMAVDVKTSPEKYEILTGKAIDFSKIVETIDGIKSSGIDYELRTTCIPDYVTIDDFERIGNRVGRVKRYFLQQFQNRVTLEESFRTRTPYTLEELHLFQRYVSTFAESCEIRGV